MSMSTIFNQEKVVDTTNFSQPLQVSRVTSNMDRNDSLGARRNSRLRLLGVYTVRVWVNIHKHGHRAAVGYDFSSSNKGEGGSDYLITGSDTKCHQ